MANLGVGLPILTGITARAIDWSGPGVRIETDQGTLSAAACIVTVSTGVLCNTLSFDLTYQDTDADPALGLSNTDGLVVAAVSLDLSLS